MLTIKENYNLSKQTHLKMKTIHSNNLNFLKQINRGSSRYPQATHQAINKATPARRLHHIQIW